MGLVILPDVVVERLYQFFVGDVLTRRKDTGAANHNVTKCFITHMPGFTPHMPGGIGGGLETLFPQSPLITIDAKRSKRISQFFSIRPICSLLRFS